MPDKSNFTSDEWKLLLESVMMASIAITAAEPHGLWGLLQEGFAGGTQLAKAKMDPGGDALIKAVVADFATAEGRGVARDGLKEKFTGSKPAEIKAKCIDTLRQVAEVVEAKLPPMPRPLRRGCDRLVSMSPRLPKRVSGHRGRGGERGREGNPRRNI
jgi:hypothetical protein